MSSPSKYFSIKEFVPPEIYNQFSDKAWQFIDPRVTLLADFIRDYFGKPMTINDWYRGGTLTLRGFRPPDRKSTRLNSSHIPLSRMPSSA